MDNAADYKERFKALWQFRQKNPLDIKSVTKSRNARILLEQGLQLKAADRITLAQIFEVLDATDEEVDDTKQAEDEPSGKRHYRMMDVGKIDQLAEAETFAESL